MESTGKSQYCVCGTSAVLSSKWLQSSKQASSFTMCDMPAQATRDVQSLSFVIVRALFTRGAMLLNSRLQVTRNSRGYALRNAALSSSTAAFLLAGCRARSCKAAPSYQHPASPHSLARHTVALKPSCAGAATAYWAQLGARRGAASAATACVQRPNPAPPHTPTFAL